MKNSLESCVVWGLVIYAVILVATALVIILGSLTWYQQVSLLFLDVLFAVFGYYVISLVKRNDDE